MKSTILLLFVILVSCSKSNPNPNEELPPATQTGAGIFACHVNGQSFIDRSGDVAYYQKIDNDFYFGVGGNDSKNTSPRNIYIQTQKKQIFEGQIYQLKEKTDYNAYGGGGFFVPNTNGYSSYTDQQYTGELKITKLNFTNNIVSGTFWFDLKNPVTGSTIQIRDGRFDTHFTQ